MAGERALQDGQ
jgi:hypothetical protein